MDPWRQAAHRDPDYALDSVTTAKFRKAFSPDPELDGFRDSVYRCVRREIADAAANKIRGLGDRPYLTDFDSLRPIDHDARRRTAARRERLLDARDTTRADLDSLAAQTALATIALIRLGRPRGLGVGITVLVVIFGLQVVPSLCYLTPTPATLTSRSATLVLGLFGLGLAVLVTYLAVYARRLRRQPAATTPPDQATSRTSRASRSSVPDITGRGGDEGR